MGKGIFITGTDTGVGKTVATAVIARIISDTGIKVGVMKPITSGCIVVDGKRISEDAQLLKLASSTTAPDTEVSPYLLEAPLAPSIAASMEGVNISLQIIRECYDRLAAIHDLVLVEGAGGLMVPIAENLLISDLIRHLDLPTLVITRPNLGTINHTLMTCFCAKKMEIELLGIIINNYPANPGTAEQYAAEMLEEYSGIPVLGVLPHISSNDPAALVEAIYTYIKMNSQSAARFAKIFSKVATHWSNK